MKNQMMCVIQDIFYNRYTVYYFNHILLAKIRGNFCFSGQSPAPALHHPVRDRLLRTADGGRTEVLVDPTVLCRRVYKNNGLQSLKNMDYYPLKPWTTIPENHGLQSMKTMDYNP